MHATETKTIEIRDTATFIPALAVLLRAPEDEEHPARYLFRRGGWSDDLTEPVNVLLMHLQTNRCEVEHFRWNSRTMAEAHSYLERNWRNIKCGQVIDVEFLLGITKEPKVSEEVTGSPF